MLISVATLWAHYTKIDVFVLPARFFVGELGLAGGVAAAYRDSSLKGEYPMMFLALYLKE
jgi:hypothetical protein